MTKIVSDIEIDKAHTRSLIEDYANVKGGLLQALHALQKEFGHIPPTSLDLLASAFNLSGAEVHGVISFYHDFRTVPAGKCQVRICQAEACQAMGSRRLTKQVEELLGLEMGETSDNHAYSLDPVYCFGNCATSPNVEIDGRLYGRADQAKIKEVLAVKS